MDPRVAEELAPSTVDEERAEYEAYRARQARALVGMLPREAVRPLYRKALESGLPHSEDDPLGTLAAFCETFLPLPTFDVWRSDRRAYPDAHMEDLGEAAGAPSAAEPVTLEARVLAQTQGAWTARLRGFRDEDAWRGFIAFEDRRSGHVHRTALIFREPDAVELRSRFLSFEPATLEAFLRSALP